MGHLDWQHRSRMSLNDITARMARISDVDTLYRLFLLAVTTDECLGFSRAILFLRNNGDEHRLVATEAFGAQSSSVAEDQWAEAGKVFLSDKIASCASAPQTRRGDLRELIPQLVLDLQQHPEIYRSFKAREMMVRRHGQAHVVHEEGLRHIVCPEDGEYVFAPLWVGGELIGAVLGDRAFLPATEIAPERLELLRLLVGQFALMLEALRLRREEQEATIIHELARGVGYSLKTRAAALEGRISNLSYALGDTHHDAIDQLKRAVSFFGRAGTVASKLMQIEEIRIGPGERYDLNAVLAEMEDALSDPRITLARADSAVYVQAEHHYIEDMLLEILWNASEFADRETGRIEVTVRAEGDMARVDCVDNGPGIHREVRADLFKPFKCYPATRMGLGLSYVERLVGAYRGTVEEIGTWKQGAHFVVRIPLAKDN